MIKPVTFTLQGQEADAGVWDAALGCLLHMCCCDGQAVCAHIGGLRPTTMRGLLDCCRQYGWSAALLFLNACVEATRSPADGSWHQGPALSGVASSLQKYCVVWR